MGRRRCLLSLLRCAKGMDGRLARKLPLAFEGYLGLLTEGRVVCVGGRIKSSPVRKGRLKVFGGVSGWGRSGWTPEVLGRLAVVNEMELNLEVLATL